MMHPSGLWVRFVLTGTIGDAAVSNTGGSRTAWAGTLVCHLHPVSSDSPGRSSSLSSSAE